MKSTPDQIKPVGKLVQIRIFELFKVFHLFLPVLWFAIFVQSGITLFFILTSTFESVLVFSGFVMGLNTFFAVAGIFVLRRRDPDAPGYRTFGYPITPLVFLGGAFYSISMLPPAWQTVTLFNPVVYLISGFRWSFFGVADVPVVWSLLAIGAFTALCLGVIWYIFRTGYRIKS